MTNDLVGHMFSYLLTFTLASAPALACIIYLLVRAKKRLREQGRRFNYSISELWVFLAIIAVPIALIAHQITEYLDKVNRADPVIKSDDYAVTIVLAVLMLCVEALGLIAAKARALTVQEEPVSRPFYLLAAALGLFVLWIASLLFMGILTGR